MRPLAEEDLSQQPFKDVMKNKHDNWGEARSGAGRRPKSPKSVRFEVRLPSEQRDKLKGAHVMATTKSRTKRGNRGTRL